MATVDRENPLYDSSLPVHIAGEDGSARSLVLRVHHGTQPSTVVGQIERIVHLEVTDDLDPCFLFYLDLSETTFPALKRSEKLSIDFHNLPDYLIMLFDQITSTASGPVELVGINGRLVKHYHTATLDTSACTISFSDVSSDGTSTWPTLPLVAGSDVAIKMYLASRLALSNRINVQSSERIEQLEQAKAELEHSGAELTKEMHEMRTRWSLKEDSLKVSHAAEVNELQRAHHQEVSQLKHDSDLMVADLKAVLERSHADHRMQHDSLSKQLAETVEITRAQAYKIDSLERDLSQSQADRQMQIAKNKDMFDSYQQLQDKHTQLTAEAVSLNHRIHTLEGVIDRKDDAIKAGAELLAKAEEANAKQEHTSAGAAAREDKLNQDVAKLRAEVDEKTNAIAKYESQRQAWKEKFAGRDRLLAELETDLQAHKKTLKQSEATCKQQEKALQQLTYELERATTKLTQAAEKASEDANELDKQKLIIEEMGKELNGFALGERAVAHPTIAGLQSVNIVSPMFTTPSQATEHRSKYVTNTTAPITFSAGAGAGMVSPVSTAFANPRKADDVIAQYGTPVAFRNNNETISSITQVPSQRPSMQPRTLRDLPARGAPVSEVEGDLDLSDISFYQIAGKTTSADSPPHKKSTVR